MPGLFTVMTKPFLWLLPVLLYAGYAVQPGACLLTPGKGSTTAKDSLLFSDDFNRPLDTALWLCEIAPQPGSRVYTADGKLVLDTKGGVTVWLKKKLKSNIRIEYDRMIPAASPGSTGNERLSDLNQFWMAGDPKNENLFTRNGVLESYDSLLLYYVGMGGNSNSTTRFRKYEGNGERRLIQEYKDSGHLLQAGKTYHITTIVRDGLTEFYVDGELYFSFTDPSPLRQGYFGFRSTKSKQYIDDLKIYRIP
ncbi:MAG: methyltransferase [Bacteroidetes bacterium]|nr:methyltransferase [Bacteroidota bacterium]